MTKTFKTSKNYEISWDEKLFLSINLFLKVCIFKIKLKKNDTKNLRNT